MGPREAAVKRALAQCIEDLPDTLVELVSGEREDWAGRGFSLEDLVVVDGRRIEALAGVVIKLAREMDERFGESE
jgi:hypothetical protein